MIQLIKHIEILLLSNDCVIVPGLGGFVTHRVNAHYDSDDCMFLPPLRTLGFNPQLQLNDSLLAVSYVEAFDISYPEAIRKIESEVEEIKQTIATEGMFEMNNIGCLSLNKEGYYMFEPCEAGVLTPNLYGLSSFDFEILPESKITTRSTIQTEPKNTIKKTQFAAVTPTVKETQADETDEDDEESNYIHINTTWIKNTAIVFAAIIIAVMFITPGDIVNGYYSQMSTWSGDIIQKLIPKDTSCETIKIQSCNNNTNKNCSQTVKTKTDSPDINPAVTNEANETLNTENFSKTENEGTETANKEYYSIVLISSIPLKNAEKYAETLNEKGYKEVSVYDNGNLTRVIYGKYYSEHDAQTSLHKLRANKDFKEAWILKIKKK